MGEFFRGWRRKIGVVTLVLACVFMAGWVRSQLLFDRTEFRSNTNVIQCLESLGGRIIWRTTYVNDEARILHRWSTCPVSPKLNPGDNPSEWTWYQWGFGFRMIEISDLHWYRTLMIPYWSIVTPLILLSAWLLLSKPKPKTDPLS